MQNFDRCTVKKNDEVPFLSMECSNTPNDYAFYNFFLLHLKN